MAASAVFTNVYRQKYAANAAAALADNLEYLNFSVGEAGFVPSGGARVPKTPDPTLTDIEADGITGFKYTRAIATAGSVVDNGSGSVTVTVILQAAEAGLDGNGILDGPDPHLYEIGIFDADGTMAVYGTYDERVKFAGGAIQFEITVTF